MADPSASSSESSCWTCAVCTYASNPSMFLACTLCSTPRNYNASDAVAMAAATATAPASSSSSRAPAADNGAAVAAIKRPRKRNLQPSSSINKKPASGGSNDDKALDSRGQKKKQRDAADASADHGDDEVNNTTRRHHDQVRGVGRRGEGEGKNNRGRKKQAQQVPRPQTDDDDDDDDDDSVTLVQQPLPPRPRIPPQHSASVNNLSDRQYCCVWNVEVFEDGYKPEVARALLARIARHVNPILRDRGWRVKRLIESCSTTFLGCCYSNGRNDADAASTNIKLNLRIQPNKHCQQFYSFQQVLKVMLHEITHTSIGLEDIHPPAFYELMNEIKQQYYDKLHAGEVDLESDTYGCDQTTVSRRTGKVTTIQQAAADIVPIGNSGSNGNTTTATSNDINAPYYMMNKNNTENNNTNEQEGVSCGVSKKRNRRWNNRRRRTANAGGSRSSRRKAKGEKRRPLLKGSKMIDGRTKVGKAAKAQQASLTPRELAAQAALARLGGGGGGGTGSLTAAATNRATWSRNNNSTGGNHDDGGDDSSCEGVTGGGGRDDYSDSDIDIDTSADGDTSSSSDDDDDDDDDDIMVPHNSKCACRSCEWDKQLFMPK